jgi:hypothetical protein
MEIPVAIDSFFNYWIVDGACYAISIDSEEKEREKGLSNFKRSKTGAVTMVCSFIIIFLL